MFCKADAVSAVQDRTHRSAIGSVILAFVADPTSEESRTQPMAIVGLSIGASFMVALVTGPILAGVLGVSGIF
jgi:hypothetical protein